VTEIVVDEPVLSWMMKRPDAMKEPVISMKEKNEILNICRVSERMRYIHKFPTA